MKQKRGKIILLFIVMATMGNACVAQESNNGKELWAKSFLNKKAPKLVVEKWLTEEPETTGKFVLIDFWATWCNPCLRFIPQLNAWHEKYKDDMVIIGISDETEDVVKGLVNPEPLYYEAIDTKARTKSKLRVTGIPHAILIDPHGVVRWEGFPFLQGNLLKEEVLEAIFEKYK
ncbi:MAG: TlpA disulfide reductase family protein [Niabella sp.]